MSLTKATYSMISGAPLNIKDFGAVGDGTTDDTAAITAALQNNNEIYVPPGTYKITSSIKLNDKTGLRIVGAGYASQFLYSVAAGADMFLVDAGHPVTHSSFENVCFLHTDTATGAPALTIYECVDFTVKGCTFERGQCKVVGGQTILITENIVTDWNFDRSGVVVQGTDIIVSNNTIRITEDMDSDDSLVVSAPSAKVTVSDNLIEKSAVTTGYCRNGIHVFRGVGSTTLREIAITGNVIVGFDVVDANTVAAIQLAPDTGGAEVFGITISGNSIKDALIGLYLNQFAANIIVDGNNFTNCVEAFKSQNGGLSKGSIVVSNNVFYNDSIQTSGINIRQGDKGVVVSGNSFYNFTDAITTETSTSMNVVGNYFRSCTNAITCNNVAGLVFNSNIMQSCTLGVKFNTQGTARPATLVGNMRDSTATLYGGAAVGTMTVTDTANISF